MRESVVRQDNNVTIMIYKNGYGSLGDKWYKSMTVHYVFIQADGKWSSFNHPCPNRIGGI